MKWEKYCKQFSDKASLNGLNNYEIELALNYAKKLFNNRVPIIYDQRHIGLLVGYDSNFLLAISNSPKHFYRHFKIEKRSGGFRQIHEPLPSLKEIQRWILDNILSKIKTSNYAYAYIKRRSIINNDRYHVGQPVVLKLDIENFFGSIKEKRILKIFIKFGYSVPVSVMLTKLCCLHDCLPQGAPTSASLSNIVAINIDKRISSLVKKLGLKYTRYSDDITISGYFDVGKLINWVRTILLDEGFSLNENKTRCMEKHQRQIVTGIIVNNKLNVPREIRRQVRQEMYYIDKYGLTSHIDKSNIERKNYLLYLLGKTSFCLNINPDDEEMKQYVSQLKLLLPERSE